MLNMDAKSRQGKAPAGPGAAPGLPCAFSESGWLFLARSFSKTKQGHHPGGSWRETQPAVETQPRCIYRLYRISGQIYILYKEHFLLTSLPRCVRFVTVVIATHLPVTHPRVLLTRLERGLRLSEPERCRLGIWGLPLGAGPAQAPQ